MYFKILNKYYFGNNKIKQNYQGVHAIFIAFNGYGVHLLTDCGEWFFYILFGKHGIMFNRFGPLIY